MRKLLEDPHTNDTTDNLPLRHSRYWMAFFRSLSADDWRHRQCRIPQVALLPVKQSPWRRILASRNNQALITCTGFDYDSLQMLFTIIQPLYDYNSPFLGTQHAHMYHTGDFENEISKCRTFVFLRLTDSQESV